MMKQCAGYTLVEIMIAVTVLGVLLAITLPNFIKARSNAQFKVCIANLNRIDAAKQQWAFDLKMDGDATPKKKDLLVYMKDMELPVCPAGGTYTLRKVSQRPSCSLSGHVIK